MCACTVYCGDGGTLENQVLRYPFRWMVGRLPKEAQRELYVRYSWLTASYTVMLRRRSQMCCRRHRRRDLMYFENFFIQFTM